MSISPLPPRYDRSLSIRQLHKSFYVLKSAFDLPNRPRCADKIEMSFLCKSNLRITNSLFFIFALYSSEIFVETFWQPPTLEQKKSPIKTRLSIEGVAPQACCCLYKPHTNTYLSLFTLHLYRTYKKNCCEMSSVRRLHLIYIFVVVDAMQIIS